MVALISGSITDFGGETIGFVTVDVQSFFDLPMAQSLYMLRLGFQFPNIFFYNANVMLVETWACLLAMLCWWGLERAIQLSVAANIQTHYYLR